MFIGIKEYKCIDRYIDISSFTWAGPREQPACRDSLLRERRVQGAHGTRRGGLELYLSF